MHILVGGTCIHTHTHTRTHTHIHTYNTQHTPSLTHSCRRCIYWWEWIYRRTRRRTHYSHPRRSEKREREREREPLPRLHAGDTRTLLRRGAERKKRHTHTHTHTHIHIQTYSYPQMKKLGQQKRLCRITSHGNGTFTMEPGFSEYNKGRRLKWKY
jgi:hypothetical protein